MNRVTNPFIIILGLQLSNLFQNCCLRLTNNLELLKCLCATLCGFDKVKMAAGNVNVAIILEMGVYSNFKKKFLALWSSSDAYLSLFGPS